MGQTNSDLIHTEGSARDAIASRNKNNFRGCGSCHSHRSGATVISIQIKLKLKRVERRDGVCADGTKAFSNLLSFVSDGAPHKYKYTYKYKYQPFKTFLFAVVCSVLFNHVVAPQPCGLCVNCMGVLFY